MSKAKHLAFGISNRLCAICLQVVNYSDSCSAEEICELSSKIITFLDLAGHQKYLKTTIFGLTGHIPDFAMLVIAANAGVGKGTNQ